MTKEDKLLQDAHKEMTDAVGRIYADVMAHPKVTNLGDMGFSGLMTKAVVAGGFDIKTIFEPVNPETAAEELKYLRYAVALSYIQDMLDSKIRLGRSEELPYQLYAQMGGLYTGYSNPERVAEGKRVQAALTAQVESFTANTQESPMAEKFNRIVAGRVESNGINDHSCAGKDCYCPAGSRQQPAEKYSHEIDTTNFASVAEPVGFTHLPSAEAIKGVVAQYLENHRSIASGLDDIVRQGGVESEITPNGGLIVTITMPDYSGLMVQPVNRAAEKDHVDFQKVYNALGLIYNLPFAGQCYSWSGDLSHYLKPSDYIRNPSTAETAARHQELYQQTSARAYEEVKKDIDFLDFKGRPYMGLEEAVAYLGTRVNLDGVMELRADEIQAAEDRWLKYAKFRADLNSFIKGPNGYIELMVKNPKKCIQLAYEISSVNEPGIAVSVKPGLREDGKPKRADELTAADFDVMALFAKGRRLSEVYKETLLDSAKLDLTVRPQINPEAQCSNPGWVASDQEMYNMLGNTVIVDREATVEDYMDFAIQEGKPSAAGLLVDPVGNQDPRNGKTIIGVLKV